MVGPDRRVALETTLLVHGVPRGAALTLYDELCDAVRDAGAEPALCGVIAGRLRPDIARHELAALLETEVPKANTANLGLFCHRGQSAATTVAGTMEIAARHGIQFFATGGLGGVHRGYGRHWDISADLAAFTRFPVAVVTSGVKSILDVVSTREALETLGVPVIGVGCDHFPAFYLRRSQAGVDARFDVAPELAEFARAELARTGRGLVLAHPIPAQAELAQADWERWLAQAKAQVSATGRNFTPALLAALHQVSAGATLEANLALIRANTRMAAALAAA